jgi:ATP-dependent Clp protease protease subunit
MKARDWFRFRQLDESATELLIYGEIGGIDWMTGERGVHAKEFAQALQRIKTPTLRIRINSPGGAVFDGLDIYDALKAHASRKLVRIGGCAASIASVIAMAGDEISIGKTGYLMIHNAWGFAIGDARDLRKYADELEKLTVTARQVYADRSGKSPDEFTSLMDAETWLTADAAKALGLVDLIDGEAQREPLKAAACIRNYRNVPPALRSSIVAIAKNATEEAQAVMGTCKMPDGSESEMDQAECEAAGGTWTGPAEESAGTTTTTTTTTAASAKPIRQSKPRPATLAELKAIPGSDPAFREQCLEQGLSVVAARDRWMELQAARIERLESGAKLAERGTAAVPTVDSSADSDAPPGDAELRAKWDRDPALRREFFNRFDTFKAYETAKASGRVLCRK